MKSFVLGAAALLLTAPLAESAQAATLLDVKKIRLSTPTLSYLQIGEVQLFNYDNVNVAPTATATSTSIWSTDYMASNLTDGIIGDDVGLFHSAGTGSSETALLTFSSLQDLSGITITGRPTKARERDIYFVEFFDSNDVLLFSTTLDARSGPASMTFDRAIVSTVPEPATWATMLLGFGFIGAALRRRRKFPRPTLAAA